MVEVISIIVVAFLWREHWRKERERVNARREVRGMMPRGRRGRY